MFWRMRFASGDEVESKTRLLTDESSSTDEDVRKYRQSLHCSLIANLLLSATLLVWSIFTLQQRWNAGVMNDSLRSLSMPSPILDSLPIRIHQHRREGAVIAGKPASIWRQDPSPEVDRAWHQIANSSSIALSAQDVRNIGYDPEKVAKWPESWGFGDDAYIGRLDVFHQIHCLNMLRHAIHWETYDGWSRASEASLKQREHVAHCLHNLLQELTCHASTDPYIHWWNDVDDLPMPDWSNHRQCKDFDAILEWQIEHGMSNVRTDGVLKKPPGAYQQSLSLEFKYMRGNLVHDPAVDYEAAQAEDAERYPGPRHAMDDLPGIPDWQ